jgi:hypothetical protein
MGRYDLLTQLDTNPRPPAPKEGRLSPAPQPESSSLSPLHANQQTRLQVKKLTSKEAYQQASKPVSTQTSKPVYPQAGLPTNLHSGKPALIKKYSTYLTPECIRGLKRIALETDRKDYDVLIEAVEQFLKKQTKA